jgi:hypothetical protein
MATIAQSYVEDILFGCQSDILAYYKKGYVSGSNYPPLSYYVDVLRKRIKKDEASDVMLRYHVSADALSEVKQRPRGISELRGQFYRIGVGWIEPDAREEFVTLVLNPRPRALLKYKYPISPKPLE